MKLKLASIFIVALLIFSACKRKEEGPVFKTVTDIDLGNISKKASKFSCNVIFTNPDDKAKYKVKQIMADLKINGKDAGTPINSNSLEFFPRSECKVPLKFEIHANDFLKEGDEPSSLPISIKGTLILLNDKNKEIKIDFSHSESVAVNIKKAEREEKKVEKKLTKEEKKARLLEMKKHKKR